MKKIFSILLMSAFIMCSLSITSVYAENTFRLEAENAQSGWRSGSNTAASNGKMSQVTVGSEGEWTVEIPKDGMYSVSAFYAASSSSVKADITLGDEKIVDKFSLPTTESNNISTGKTVVFLEDYALKAGNYTVKFSVTGSTVILDYIDIIKTGDYSGNSLNGDSLISALKYETQENTVQDNGMLKMPSGSKSVYKISSKKENVYGVKLNSYGTADISIYADDILVYSGENIENELFSYKISDTASVFTIEVENGEIKAESIEFILKDPTDTAAEADYKKYEIESADEYYFANGINKGNGVFGVNRDDWFDYYVDVSKLGAGEYKMTLRYATAGTVGVCFEVDSGDTLATNVLSTGSFTTFKVAELGTINIGEEHDKLRLTVTTSSGMMADWFSLEKVDVDSEYKFIAADGNVPAVNNYISKGADFIDAVFSYYIDPTTVNADSVTLTKNGSKVNCDLEVIDTVIRMKLKESLDSNTEYTINIANTVKGLNGKEINSDVSDKFTTNDDDTVLVKGLTVIDSYSNNYENFKVFGTALSSQNIGISGREIYASAYDKYGMPVNMYYNTAVSGENGSFTLDFSLSDETLSGAIRFVIEAQYAENAEFTVNYISKNFERGILKAISETKDVSEVEQIFKDNESILLVDLESDFEGISDTASVYSRFVGITFSDIESLTEEYKRSVSFYASGEKLTADLYSFIDGGSKKDSTVTLNSGGEIRYNFVLPVSGYYVVRLNVKKANNNNAEIYFGDTLMSTVEISEGSSTVATLKTESGKTVVTLKNIAGGTLEFDEITVSQVDINEAKKGFGTLKVLGASFREGEGIGHYFKNGRNVTGTTVGINNGDWFYYDFDTLGAGNYKITFQYTSPNNTDVTYKDETGAEFKYELPSTGGWGVTKVYEAGTINLKGDKVWLYLTSVTGLSLQHVIFERIDAPLSYYTTFANGEKIADNTKISRGTDKLDIHFTSVPESVNSSHIRFVKDGYTVPCEYEINENTVILKLKETLDYNTEYKLIITGLTSTSGQKFQGKSTVCLNTDDATNNLGNDSAQITESFVNYENVTLKGVVKSSAGIPIKGRKISVTAKDLNRNTVNITGKTGISGENGEFTVNAIIPSGTPFGNITFSVLSEYGFIPSETVLPYISKDEELNVCDELKETVSANDVKIFFEKYKNMLDLNILKDLSGFSENEQLEFYGRFPGKRYTNVNEIKNSYKSTVMLFEINGASNVREISKIFENIEYLEAFGIDTEMLSEISNNKNSLLSEIVALDKNEDIKKLSEICGSVIKKYFLKEYQKITLHFVTNGSSVRTGQSVELKTGFNNKTSDVKEINMTFCTSKDGLFVNANSKDEINVSANGKIITYNKKLDGKEITEVGKINIIAPKDAGSYKITVKGDVIYEITAASGKIYTVSDAGTEKEITVTVSKDSSSSSQSSSRPVGGGVSSIDNSSVTQIPSDPGTNNTDVPKETYKFNDLVDCRWAENSIYALLSKGIISESENKLFNPNNNITREEFVKMIVCAFGLIDNTAKADFNDVSVDSWYYSYAASALKYGIINGDTNGNFGAGKLITREDMAVIIDRLLKKLGYTEETKVFESFEDEADISGYALEAVNSVRQKEIINGIGNNIFAPKSNATRAQAAKMIYGLMEYAVK